MTYSGHRQQCWTGHRRSQWKCVLMIRKPKLNTKQWLFRVHCTIFVLMFIVRNSLNSTNPISPRNFKKTQLRICTWWGNRLFRINDANHSTNDTTSKHTAQTETKTTQIRNHRNFEKMQLRSWRRTRRRKPEYKCKCWWFVYFKLIKQNTRRMLIRNCQKKYIFS